MSCEVRYYSRSGNTKKIAEAIAEGAGVKAMSVVAPGAATFERTDVLFLGGALYAYGLDEHLKSYFDTLSKEKVGKAVVFSTSWLSKHALDLIRKGLEEKGIPVENEVFYCKSGQVEKVIGEAKAFGKKFAK